MVIANKGDNDDAEFLLPVKYKSLFQMLKFDGYILCRTKKWKDGNIVEKNTFFFFFFSSRHCRLDYGSWVIEDTNLQYVSFHPENMAEVCKS